MTGRTMGLARAAVLATVAAMLVLGGAGHATAQDTAQEGTGSLRLTGVTPPPPRADGRVEYAIGTTDGTLEIDGLLDEPAWATASVVPLPWEVNPGENVQAPVLTECLLTQDEDHLYLGCSARDPEPGAIRAYVVDRDGIGGHDRIVLTLDPFNDQRRAFQFGISALGVQSDAILAQQGAANPNQGPNAMPIDPSWDAIWSSAGRVTEEGFVVEAAIPFRSLRFPDVGDEPSNWGVVLTRWWPRSSNVEVRSATWDRGDSCVLCQANVLTGVRGGAPGINLQLTPTLTGSRTERRASVGSPLVADPMTREVGLDAQWGITSDLTLNLTANPDFSQVEADVAQLDVNNRFALFFPETRPFFLEGADFFGTPLQAVFTRSIAEPTAGAKLTGKLGRSAVGVLAAQDAANHLLIPGSQFSSTATIGGRAGTLVGRFRRDIGGTSTFGGLLTAREGDGYHNRVGGVDAFIRPVSSLTLQAQLLRSNTVYPATVAQAHDQPDGDFSGTGAALQWNWSTSDWGINGNARSLDRGFRADAGFVTQAGVRSGNLNLTRRWWGGSDQWFNQIRLESGVWHTRDFDGNQINGGIWFGLGYQGPGQTSIGIWPNLFMEEYFAGQSFEGLNQLWFDVRAAPAGHLSLGLNGNLGDVVDFANERLGSELRLAPNLTFRLGRNVEADARHTWQRLTRDGREVFTANLSQLRTVYNFSPRSYLRAVVQYRRTDRSPTAYTSPVDRRSEEFFAQFLYAYTLNPQTVFFLGYGQDGSGLTSSDNVRNPVTTLGRTFFVKLGYAWRP